MDAPNPVLLAFLKLSLYGIAGLLIWFARLWIRRRIAAAKTHGADLLQRILEVNGIKIAYWHGTTLEQAENLAPYLVGLPKGCVVFFSKTETIYIISIPFEENLAKSPEGEAFCLSVASKIKTGLFPEHGVEVRLIGNNQKAFRCLRIDRMETRGVS